MRKKKKTKILQIRMIITGNLTKVLKTLEEVISRNRHNLLETIY